MSGMEKGSEFPARWHSTYIRVPLFEVDLGQAVYHGNYYHLFELARETFLKDLGYPYKRLMERELHLAVVEATCKYRRPAHYDERLEIRTAVRWLRRRSLSMAQEIYLAPDCPEESPGENPPPVLCTTLVLNMVCVRFSGQATLIPPDFAECLEKWAMTPF